MSIREAREKLSTENEHRDDLLQRFEEVITFKIFDIFESFLYQNEAQILC